MVQRGERDDTKLRTGTGQLLPTPGETLTLNPGLGRAPGSGGWAEQGANLGMSFFTLTSYFPFSAPVWILCDKTLPTMTSFYSGKCPSVGMAANDFFPLATAV